MSREPGDWRYTFHEAACISSDPREVCDRCGATQDRAIHSERYARENGLEFVALAAPFRDLRGGNPT